MRVMIQCLNRGMAEMSTLSYARKRTWQGKLLIVNLAQLLCIYVNLDDGHVESSGLTDCHPSQR